MKPIKKINSSTRAGNGMQTSWSKIKLTVTKSGCPVQIRVLTEAPFKRRATAVPNSIDRIKFDFSTAVARRLKPSRATAV